jgi:hypothetical protein
VLATNGAGVVMCYRHGGIEVAVNNGQGTKLEHTGMKHGDELCRGGMTLEQGDVLHQHTHFPKSN